MGYIRHHTILVTSYDRERVVQAHEKAVEIFGPIVSELRESIINGYHSFAIIIFPDGSTEGWQPSDHGDKGRDLYRSWLKSQVFEDGSSPFDWVELQYGDDNGDTRILHNSDEYQTDRAMTDEELYADSEITVIMTQLNFVCIDSQAPLYYRIDQNKVDQDTIELVMHRTRGGVDRLRFKVKHPC